MKKYKILITNDDGLFSEGLFPLADEMKKIGDICIIIPEKEMSAASHSLTLFNPVRVKDIKINNYKIKLVSGTPADCVRLGIIEFQKRKTDIVISGINQGPNLGQDVNYSGTVAAAREAMFLNIPAIAVSTISKNNYLQIAKITKEIVKFALKTKNKFLLNINFPAKKPKGIKITTLGTRRYEDVVHKKIDPIGIPYYWLKSSLIKNVIQKNSNTDVKAIEEGFISITPLTYDTTNYQQIDTIQKLFKNFNI